MTKNRVTRGIQAAVLAFAVVLAGCASAPANSGGGGTSGGTSGNNEAAAKLAKDLNAAKAGGTVTLSGWVELNTALTVPEGVTLDLTEEGAGLELQDGAVLTVNGTVRTTGHGDHGKGWVEGALRVGDGAATINGSGTIKLTSKGRLLNIGSDKGKRQLTLDGVTLVGLPDNDSSLVGIYENSEFVLKSGAITGNTYNSNEWATGGGVNVWYGTFTMEGGEISGNTASCKEGGHGGGVSIGEKAVFTMTGGAISGNTAQGRNALGGGVNGGFESSFTLSGGTISGNIAVGTRNGGGGGVNMNKNKSFTMTGGTISANTASGDSAGMGGGVRLGLSSTFTLSGGTISGNNAKSKAGGVDGGGVTVGDGSMFTMKGGAIAGNTVGNGRGRGGGVSVNKGDSPATFIMEGGTIYGKAGSLPAGTDSSLANSAGNGASLVVNGSTAKWGTGGTYTKGGVPQSGGSDIGSTTDDTLIAVPQAR